MDNKYCPSCAGQLDVDGSSKGKKFTVVTVSTSHQREPNRRAFAKNPGTALTVLEWVMRGGKPPPEYKPATVVGSNGALFRSPVANLLTGRREYLLVRNPPSSAIMRRLLGMSTLRVCQECYDNMLRNYPRQLQPRS